MALLQCSNRAGRSTESRVVDDSKIQGDLAPGEGARSGGSGPDTRTMARTPLTTDHGALAQTRKIFAAFYRKAAGRISTSRKGTTPVCARRAMNTRNRGHAETLLIRTAMH